MKETSLSYPGSFGNILFKYFVLIRDHLQRFDPG